METKNTFVKKFGTSFLTTLAILAGMWAAFATWTWWSTDFAASQFHNWQAITPNMIASSLLWYVRDASGNNIYWRKYDTTTRTLGQASEFCASKWMWLPSFDQSNYYSANAGTYRWIDTNGTSVVGYSSMTSGSNYHNTWQQYNTNISCSSWHCAYYWLSYPWSWTSYTYAYWYSAYQTVCVYKRWY